MGASRTSFEKLQRDRAKKARAAAKREKRLDKDAAPEAEDADVMEQLSSFKEGEEIPPDQLLKMVAELHKQFEDEEITFEEFEDRKMELFALLSVD